MRVVGLLCVSSLTVTAACGSHRGAAPGVGDAAPAADAAPAVVDAGPPVDLGPAGDFAAYADSAATVLHGYYNMGTGLWSTTGWWNSANALTAVVNYEIATGWTSYDADIARTFAVNRSTSFLNSYYDDEGWWGLAWLRAYDLKNDPSYLAMAKTIFADMTGGWDDHCGGGVWWNKSRGYKNAIPNELFLSLAAGLHARTPGDSGPGSFLDWAQREWAWFDQSGMINSDGLINDGLTAACANNKGTTWTYNQGVILGGLVDLAAATGDATLLDRATTIADAAMDHLTESHGVLREPCEPTSCGGDGSQFKGIFVRNLAALQNVTGDPRARAFLATNADWLWNAARNASGHFGLMWSGAFDSADASRQSSALDALNAVIPFSQPVTNLARAGTATGNGSCAPGQTADMAIDGKRVTKWCAGATAGAYWLEVDLGAPTEVGRIIVRHASSGGEKPAWNTRDFALTLDGDGAAASATAPVAQVTGNTLGVTIHRFASSLARRVRLDISAPQTDPQTVAARIYELEIYPR